MSRTVNQLNIVSKFSTPVIPFIVNLGGAKSVQGGGQNPQKFPATRGCYTSDILCALPDLIPGYASASSPLNGTLNLSLFLDGSP